MINAECVKNINISVDQKNRSSLLLLTSVPGRVKRFYSLTLYFLQI